MRKNSSFRGRIAAVNIVSEHFTWHIYLVWRSMLCQTLLSIVPYPSLACCEPEPMEGEGLAHIRSLGPAAFCVMV
jgi:hypothetical protein